MYLTGYRTCTLIIPFALSTDYFLITANVLNSGQNAHCTRNNQYIRLYWKADFSSIECFLDFAANTYVSANIDNVEHALSILKQMLTDGCDQFIPKYKVPLKPTPSWFNSNVCHLLNQTHTLTKTSQCLQPQQTLAHGNLPSNLNWGIKRWISSTNSITILSKPKETIWTP